MGSNYWFILWLINTNWRKLNSKPPRFLPVHLKTQEHQRVAKQSGKNVDFISPKCSELQQADFKTLHKTISNPETEFSFQPCAGRGPWRGRGSRCGGNPGAESGPGGVQPAPRHCRTPRSSWKARETTRPSSPPAAANASRLHGPQFSWAERSKGRWAPSPTPAGTQRDSG